MSHDERERELEEAIKENILALMMEHDYAPREIRVVIEYHIMHGVRLQLSRLTNHAEEEEKK